MKYKQNPDEYPCIEFCENVASKLNNFKSYPKNYADEDRIIIFIGFDAQSGYKIVNKDGQKVIYTTSDENIFKSDCVCKVSKPIDYEYSGDEVRNEIEMIL